MTADDLLARADRLLATARLVGKADAESACDRAYYAMFHATRAALIHVGQRDRAAGKTHAGLRSAFSEHLVRPGTLDISHSRAIAAVERDRIAANYLDEPVSVEAAADAIEAAEAFVAAVRRLTTPPSD